MSKNLKLWETVSRTPTQYVKAIKNNKGKKLHDSVDSTYQKQLLTQHFGLAGIGWGLTSLEWEHYNVPNYEGVAVPMLALHTALFFVYDGQRGEIPISVSMEVGTSMKTSDHHKKLRTMAISKAISDLGFSADVFMGKFDDAQYVAESKQEEFKQQTKDMGIEELRAQFTAEKKAGKMTHDRQRYYMDLIETMQKNV